MSRIVLLSNDYAERAKARGACVTAVQWMHSAQYLSLRAMWELCPEKGWQAFVGNVSGATRARGTCCCRGCSDPASWSFMEPFVRTWLGLPVRK